MSEAVGFVESLAKAFFGQVVARYLSIFHAASSSRVELVLREGPYDEGKVVVVDKPSQRLYIGQPVFVLLESTGARWGRIQSLRVDDVDVSDLPANTLAPKGVGMSLDFKFPKRRDAKLVALMGEDDLVWSPLTRTASG